MQTVNLNGTLLKPDRPALPMDITFLKSLSQQTPELFQLVSTFSKHILFNSTKATILQYNYILGADLSASFNITPKDLGLSNNFQYIVYDYFFPSGYLKIFDNNTSLYIPPLPKFKNNSINFKYYCITPLSAFLTNGLGWVILGENNKFITTSSQRFSDWKITINDPTTNTLQVSIKGISHENIELNMMNIKSVNQLSPLKTIGCQLNDSGKATLKCISDSKNAGNNQCQC